jgi:hypothetical protein
MYANRPPDEAAWCGCVMWLRDVATSGGCNE